MPIVLLVMLGVLDLGRTFFAYVTVANAAREGARYASVHPSATEDTVRQRVESEMGGTLGAGSGGVLAVERSSLGVTDTITVTVRYSFTTLFLSPVSGLMKNFWGGPIIPNPIGLVAHAIIPISPGNWAADQANATASAVTAATATAQTIPTGTPTQSPTVTPTPAAAWITLSSFTAFSGESLTIRGCNFHQNKTVTISWDGADGWTSTTDNAGCFGPASFIVPASTSGSYHTVAARTESGQNTLSATASPLLYIAATPTATATATWTPTATATGTATSTPTNTSTATATPFPIVVYEMTEGDGYVAGSTAVGATIEVRDMTADGRPTIGTGTVSPSGTFSITVSPLLVADHEIIFSASTGAVASGWVTRANPTATPTASPTGTATQTATATPTPTATPPSPQTCTGTAVGGTVYNPDGSKSAGVTVSLIMDGQTINTATTGGSGTYNFTVDFGGTPLIGNRQYEISAAKSGYTSNWTSTYLPCSQSVTAADITLSSATPTPTSTSSPPSSPTLSGTCTSNGANYYHSLSWNSVAGAANYYVYKYSGATSTWQWVSTTASTLADEPASANSIYRYYVTAVNGNHVESYPSNMISVVCGNTPTPSATPTITPAPSATPTPYPDLFPVSISTDPSNYGIVVEQPVTVTIVFRNQGLAPISTLFWVDLYVDPSPAPPALIQQGAAWQAVSYLGAGSSMSLVFTTRFSGTGMHLLYSQIDSNGDVPEGDESNNVSNPYTIWVNAAATPTATATPLVSATPTGTPVETPTPTSTPAESPTPSATPTATPQPGSISGDTYVYANGTWTLQGRIAIYVYSGSVLVSSGFSDLEGHFQIGGLPPGTYSVVGEAEVSGQLFADTRVGVLVTSGTDSSGTDLFLFSW
ncbi:MAG: pilus assembly protein [Chloroflexi bacterium]|nr:pilus assembly protein [Chloroflexota bacterium]